ncbi:MAG: DUF4301 family protein [Candidatus Omnitrophica bacterium]|nr:DUF4301 family protein [Candidatus Omnitrophota bacterium]
MFSESDLRQMRDWGMDPSDGEAQLQIFRKGIRPIELISPCVYGNGLFRFDEIQPLDHAKAHFEEARSGGRICFFIPASGAATRMFKSALAIRRDHGRDPTWVLPSGKSSQISADERSLAETLAGIKEFAFWPQLSAALKTAGFEIDFLSARGQVIPVIDALLNDSGLGYEKLPKGLIPFHRGQSGEPLSACEEHVREALLFGTQPDGRLRMHFTVAPEHEGLFRRQLAPWFQALQAQAVRLEAEFSHQSRSTDTIAADLLNEPFRTSDGKLVFRPAGHGALLRNLEMLRGDIVFIKNIDNIQPDHRKGLVAESQRVLGGILADRQKKIFQILRSIENGGAVTSGLDEARDFLSKDFGVEVPEFKSRESACEWFFKALNRPLRVCGMVKNQGEPGGGPFWVRDKTGKKSLQIVERFQTDFQSSEQAAIFAGATHFNPVNLVCGLRDFRGQPFRLSDYADPETGFISRKSHEGRELQALELPGLWNGAMAGWLTYFVEVPQGTFAPVKELNDLLRPEHQRLL